jgi:hypothetical protein
MTMADRFAADPLEAGRVAGELTGIRSGLGPVGGLFAGAEATGSGRVQGALQRFRDDSTESRTHMGDLLDRAAGMLVGLADGASAVDQALSDALEPDQPAAPAPAAVP